MLLPFSFFRHLRRRHPDTYNEYEQQRDGQSKDANQTSMSSFVAPTDGKFYTSMHPRQRLLSNSLALNLIVSCGLPMSIVDNPHFRQFVADLDPKFAIPCRQTLSNTILPEVLRIKQEKLKEFLASCEHVALTADIWTDRRAHAFLGITVHAFHAGQPVSHLLAFNAFHGSHTGQKIAESMADVIADNQLETKVRCVITDNASNMVKAMSVLFEATDDGYLLEYADPTLWEDMETDVVDDVLHNLPVRMSCFAHSLQLVVRDGLSSTGIIRTTLAKCSKLANLIHQSCLFRSAFEAELGPGKSIPATNDTRWNSTYRQLRAIVELDHAKLATVLRQSNHENLVMSTKEIQQVRELTDILEQFAEATDINQSEKMVTVSCIVPTVVLLAKTLTDMMAKPTSFSVLLKHLLQGLHDRFHDIFTDLGISRPPQIAPLDRARRLKFDDGLLLMAPALDPGFAYNWLQDHPGDVEDKQQIRQRINGSLYFNL